MNPLISFVLSCAFFLSSSCYPQSEPAELLSAPEIPTQNSAAIDIEEELLENKKTINHFAKIV